MGCGVAEATGLGFVCFVVVINLFSQPTEILGNVFHKFSNLTPPPTHTDHPLRRRASWPDRWRQLEPPLRVGPRLRHDHPRRQACCFGGGFGHCGARTGVQWLFFLQVACGYVCDRSAVVMFVECDFFWSWVVSTKEYNFSDWLEYSFLLLSHYVGTNWWYVPFSNDWFPLCTVADI